MFDPFVFNITLSKEQGCGVATDGSLYNKYPKFAQRIQEALVDIFGEKGKCVQLPDLTQSEWL